MSFPYPISVPHILPGASVPGAVPAPVPAPLPNAINPTINPAIHNAVNNAFNTAIHPVDHSVDGDGVESSTTRPWEDEDYVPMTSTGKQKSPNQIRNELQRYIDTSNETQTSIIQRLGVNNNTFRKFMNPKTYKNQWSACQNGTYLAAARFLEQRKSEKRIEKKAGIKRKSDDSENFDFDESSSPAGARAAKRPKSESRREMDEYMARVAATPLPPGDGEKVYDSCPEMVKKVKAFLKKDGVTKATFLRLIGGVNSNSMNRFLAGKQQDQAGNIAYRKSYAFFEKMRIMENKAKTKKRLENEAANPNGFPLEAPRKARWVYMPTF